MGGAFSGPSLVWIGDFVHGACGFAVFVINGGILYVDENNSQLWLLASEYVLKKAR